MPKSKRRCARSWVNDGMKWEFTATKLGNQERNKKLRFFVVALN